MEYPGKSGSLNRCKSNLMRNTILTTVILCLLTNYIHAQVTLETFLSITARFVNAEYSKKDLKLLKLWSDSSFSNNNNRKNIRQMWYKGKITTVENATIEFLLESLEMKSIADRKTFGSITIAQSGDCNSSICATLGIIAEKNIIFNTINVIKGFKCNCEKINLKFDNYNPATNNIFNRFDTSFQRILRQEYFDFYFADLNRQTSTWQSEFKTFGQPKSEVFSILASQNRIEDVFAIMSLNNKNYNWFLAEGLWYYISKHDTLTSDQMRIIMSYNGKKNLIPFRSKVDLDELYNLKD